MKTTGTTTDYKKPFEAKFKWLIIGGIAAIIMAAIGGQVGLEAQTVITTYAVFVLIAYTSFALAWPDDRDQGLWAGFKVAMVPAVLLGYRKEGLSSLPWKIILTLGLAASLLAPSSVVSFFGADAEKALTIVAIVSIYLPASYLLGYLVGKVYRDVEIAYDNYKTQPAEVEKTEEPTKVEEAIDAIKEATDKMASAAKYEANNAADIVSESLKEATASAEGIFANAKKILTK